MFPLPFNFPFRKKDGTLTTISDFISSGGGSYTLPTASASTKGGVKIGNGLTMTGEVLSNDNPTPYTLPTAGSDTKGGVKVGAGLSMDGEVLSNTNPTPYTLPTAGADTKGGIKVGTGLNVNNDVLTPNDVDFDNEVVIGHYGGRLVYRKLVDVGTLPNADALTYPHGISNIYQILNVTGVGYRGEGTADTVAVTIPSVGAGSQPNPIYGMSLSATATSIIVTTGNDRTSMKGLITLIYTKTT